MKVRITSDSAFPTSVKITTPEGTVVPMVYAAVVQLRYNETVKATISVHLWQLDVIAEADFLATTMPDGKKYRLVPL